MDDNNELTDFERLLLTKAFEGEFNCLPEFKRQIQYLKVIERGIAENKGEHYTYTAKFNLDSSKRGVIDPQMTDIVIQDVRLKVKEYDRIMSVSVTVLDGYIQNMVLGAKYNFNKPTIEKIFWARRVPPDHPVFEGETHTFQDGIIKEEYIYTSNQRAFESGAIGYIPAYK